MARDGVEVGPGRPSTQRLRWKDLTLYCDSNSGGYTTILSGENGTHSVWVDNCKIWNKQGRWAASSQAFGNRYVSYVTGGLTTQMANGPGGGILRGPAIEILTSDAWTGSGKLVVNCTTRDIDPGSTGAHPDFHQSYAVDPDWVENVILYNVSGYDCISQGLFGSRLRNSAFVNVVFEKASTVMLSQYSGPMENVLFLHLDIVSQSWLWRDGYTPTDVYIGNGLFQNMSATAGANTAGLTIDRNHFVDPTRTMGSNITTGDPLYMNPGTNDFRIQPTSPAFGTGVTLQCVPADINGTPYGPAANRGSYAREKGTAMRLQ